MKVAIVTGANGFVGHHLVKILSEQNYYVIAIVRSESSNIETIKTLKNVLIVSCDMKNIESLVEKITINTENSLFFHLAWDGSSGNRRTDYDLQFDNAKYTIKTAIVAKKLGCRRFIVSGSVTQLMYQDYLRKDKISPELVTCYAVGKIAAEQMLKCVCADIDLEYCWAYIANFYGTDDTTNNFINFLIDTYLKKETPILTPAEQLADFIYVTDVAKGLLVLGEKGKANNSYYLGYGEPKPLKYFINIIHKKIAPEIESGIGKKVFEGLNVDFELIDYKKLYKDTGFKPNVTFESGIQNVIVERR